MAMKFGTKLAITRPPWKIIARCLHLPSYFRARAIRWCDINFPLINAQLIRGIHPMDGWTPALDGRVHPMLDGLVGHSDADDTQVYISTPAASASISTQRFITCVERIDAWMRSNRLRMNADEDTARVAWNTTAACQADHYRATTNVCPRQAIVRSAQPWRQHWRPARHGRPRRHITPRSCLF